MSSAGNPGTCVCAGRPPGCSRPRQQFRRIIGYSDLAKLAVAVEHDLAARLASIHPTSKEDTLIALTV